ncbi:MAG: hypothetical protein M0R80_26225, partial [Proteobacteria bacterium]|nr:hypothetical protein [Pseudomonadota bacterium]
GDQGSASATGIQGSASATGDQGSASATGDQGSASATGIQGSASATGYKGSASATGREGTALSFHCAEAGDKGTIIIKWWDETAERFRVTVGYVGEDGIKPKTKYVLNKEHKFVEVQ